jgi:hypothetical protein
LPGAAAADLLASKAVLRAESRFERGAFVRQVPWPLHEVGNQVVAALSWISICV